MSVVYKFLFPAKPVGNAFSLFLLALRILFGVLLLSHGIQKWTNFSAMSGSFPDPLGVGSTLSLGLAFFGEVFCSGFYIRCVLSPGYDPDGLYDGNGLFCDTRE